MTAIREQSPRTTDGPQIESLEFMERARVVLDDYSATMRGTIPNLGDKINLKDFNGAEWTVNAVSDDDQEIDGILLEKVDGSGTAYLDEIPFGASAVGLHLYEPEQVLEFFEGKMRELLGPIKAAQALRSAGQ